MVVGATGGHIFPALAVAEELQDRWNRKETAEPDEAGCTIAFLGTGRALEFQLISPLGLPLHTVPAAGLIGISGLQFLRNLLVLPHTFVETARVLRDVRPDVVLGVGGYLAGPAMVEAALTDIPTLLIEPNALPGFTNRVLAPLVRVAAVGFEESAEYYGMKAHITGHAVRREFFGVPRRVHEAPFTVAILGGSQGSAAINKTIREALPLLLPDAPRLRLIHQTGERDYNVVCEAYRACGIPAEIHSFIENMPEVFARADLVISRSGAAAVSELAAAGKASILIPFPASADHHQLANARALERAGGASVIAQNELTAERLVTEVWQILVDKRRLEAMERAARTLARPDAAGQIAELLERLAEGRALA